VVLLSCVQGKVDKSVLAAATAPAPTIRGREHTVFNYRPGTPLPSRSSAAASRLALGTPISLGRGRWVSEGTSIFSIAEGKRLASTPPDSITAYDGLRMAKIQKASLESPVVAGLRLLPEFTPGRALLWGTFLAMWGTGALMATAAKRLEIDGAEGASAKIRAALLPLGSALEGLMAPLKGGALAVAGRGMTAGQNTQDSELVWRLRTSLFDKSI
jgi:hypothetical protein